MPKCHLYWRSTCSIFIAPFKGGTFAHRLDIENPPSLNSSIASVKQGTFANLVSDDPAGTAAFPRTPSGIGRGRSSNGGGGGSGATASQRKADLMKDLFG